MIAQFIDRRGVANEFPDHVTISSSISAFCILIFIQIPEDMDGSMKHETSAKCRASRSVKQS